MTLKTSVQLLIACAIGIVIGGAAAYLITSNRGLHVQSFSADTHTVLVGEPVTFSWNVSEATEVAFRFVHLPTYSDGDLWEWVHTDVSAGGLPPVGQWSYIVPPDLVDSRFKFEIEGADQAGNKVAARSDEITIQYRPCFDGTIECATAPIKTRAILQAFEHGYMLWREDTQTIYAMESTNKPPQALVGWHAYKDTWTENDQYSLEGQPPTGLFQPLTRFTKVIAINGLQADLGWATAPESIFEGQIQQTRIACSASCSPSLLIQFADGRLLRFSAMSVNDFQQGYSWQITPGLSVVVVSHQLKHEPRVQML